MLNLKNHFIYVAILMKSISLVAGLNINCNYIKDDYSYKCEATSVEPITAENQAITVSGTHFSGLNGNNVTNLIYANLASNYYANKISDTFPNMRNILIEKSQLNTLTTNAFTQCSKLDSLGITENNFPTIPASFAESCTELRNLFFVLDGIKTIHRDAFKGLAKVQYLTIENNSITYIEPGTLQPMKILESLALRFNQISEIDSETFVGLTKLTYLDLTFNHIKVLPKFNFDGITSLQLVSIGSNNISAIQSTFGEIFPTSAFSLWYVQLNSNECIDDAFNAQKPMTIESTANLSVCFENYDKLVLTTTLPPITTPGSGLESCAEHKDCRYFLDQNRKYTCVLENVDLLLTSIGGVHVSGFTDADVKKVYVVDSTLSKVPRVIFDKFSSVEFLSVSNAEMTIFNDHTFEVCGANLSVLDASNNQIREVTENSLILCQKLETLDLTNNPVEEFKSGIYEADKNLKHVIMSRVIPALP